MVGVKSLEEFLLILGLQSSGFLGFLVGPGFGIVASGFLRLEFLLVVLGKFEWLLELIVRLDLDVGIHTLLD